MRIVSLCPSSTELVFALGRGGQLVGRTRYCVRPPEGVAEVPTLGGTKNPLMDELLALRPSLVLLNEEENRREDAEALSAAGIQTLSSLPTDIASTLDMIRTVGQALGADLEAESIVRDIEEEEKRTLRAARGQARVPVAYLIWRKPWMAAGAGTYIDSLLTTAGSENIFRYKKERYPEIRAEELGRAQPEAVFLSSEPFPFSPQHIEELAASAGLPEERFHLVDGQALSWHGSRTRQGLAYARGLLRDLRISEAAREEERERCP